MRRFALSLLCLAALASPSASAATLVASAARTTSDVAAVSMAEQYAVEGAVFQLAVTVAATDVGDTLNVYIQQSVDGGTTWDDFVSFTQVLGNGGAKVYLATWNRVASPATAVRANADGALAAGTVLQGPVAPRWRVKWVIVDAGADADQSFTFSVSMETVRGSR